MKQLYWTGIFALLGAGMWAATPATPSRPDSMACDPTESGLWDDTTEVVEEVEVPAWMEDSTDFDDMEPVTQIVIVDDMDPAEKELRKKYANQAFSAVDARGCKFKYLIGYDGRSVTLVSGDARGAETLEIPSAAHAFDLDFEVAYIGSNAFFTPFLSSDGPMKGVKTLILGDYVQWIEEKAFANAPDLEKVVVNVNLEEIKSKAFLGCEKLREVDFPEESWLTTIGNYAFVGCPALKEFHIPDMVESFSGNALSKCSALETLTVGESNLTYEAVDNVLYSVINESLIFYPMGKKDKSFQIKYGTKNIAPHAFYNIPALESVSFPASMKTIKKCAFYYCPALKELRFSGPLDYIGPDAFDGCSALKEVTLYSPTMYCDGLIGEAASFPKGIKVKMKKNVEWKAPSDLNKDPLKAVFTQLSQMPYFKSGALPAEDINPPAYLGKGLYTSYYTSGARPEILEALAAIPEELVFVTHTDGRGETGRMFVDRKRNHIMLYRGAKDGDSIIFFENPDMQKALDEFEEIM